MSEEDDRKNVVDLNEARKTIGQRKKAQSSYKINRQGAASGVDKAKPSFLKSKVGSYIQFFLFLLLLGYLMRQCQ